MKKKIIIATAILMAFIQLTANADVLGTQKSGWSSYLGGDTYFYNKEFYSDSVGKQNEYFIEYTPNTQALPIVVNGYSIWGTRTITQAEQYMRAMGMEPLAGINADYFSFKTGIPMGHTIINGEIVSKEYGGQDAIGFRSDGTGIIDWLDISTTLSRGYETVEVQYINKWCQPGFDPIYLLTDKFGDSTKTASNCIFVICTPLSGRLHIDERMELRVDDVFEYNGAIGIPEGKIVLTMDTSAGGECYDFLSRCMIGETLTVSNEAVGNGDRWNDIQNAVSSVGGRLVKDGAAQSGFEAGAAPRTAVGIKADGNIIFYTIDGRQKDHSYGAQLATLAKRMVELGCVEAINLDGGGSTTISAKFPDKDSTMIVNSPSDGKARSVANFLFVRKNNATVTGEAGYRFKDGDNTNYLSGMTCKVELMGKYDAYGNLVVKPVDVTYRAETDTPSYMDEEGCLMMKGSGLISVIANKDGRDIAGQLYTTYETPEEIKIFDTSNWSPVEEITTEPAPGMEISLSAASYVNNTELHSNNRLYDWSVQGNIGSVSPDGILTLAKVNDGEGSVTVSVGGVEKKIQVHIDDHISIFADTEGHWSRAIADYMNDRGIITGIKEEGISYFKPDENITRAQFAMMIVKYKGINIDSFSGAKLSFTDSEEIPLWAQNAVKAAYEKGFIMGRTNEDGSITFNPDDNITRAEAMAILGRAIDIGGASYDTSFTDGDDIPLWAREGIDKLCSMGIINGYEDGSILPLNNITRAESAAMLYKLETR